MAFANLCFGKKPDDEDSKRSDAIERQLRADRKKAESEIKMLLLGKQKRHISHYDRSNTLKLACEYRSRGKWKIDRSETDAHDP
jgi:hypothetical protein